MNAPTPTIAAPALNNGGLDVRPDNRLLLPIPHPELYSGVLRVLLIPYQEDEEEGSVLDCGDFEYGIKLI